MLFYWLLYDFYNDLNGFFKNVFYMARKQSFSEKMAPSLSSSFPPSILFPGFFGDNVSLCSSDYCPGTPTVDQAVLKLRVLSLSLPLECSD